MRAILCAHTCVSAILCARAARFLRARACVCTYVRMYLANRLVYPGFRARVAKLVMYLTWDNRRRQVSRTRLLSRRRPSRDGPMAEPGKKTRKAAVEREIPRQPHAYTHTRTTQPSSRVSSLFARNVEASLRFLNVTMVADKEINQSAPPRNRRAEGRGRGGARHEGEKIIGRIMIDYIFVCALYTRDDRLTLIVGLIDDNNRC